MPALRILMARLAGFGLAQFPIYLLPLVLKPPARRLGRG
jgi:hypothetical protein